MRDSSHQRGGCCDWRDTLQKSPSDRANVPIVDNPAPVPRGASAVGTKHRPGGHGLEHAPISELSCTKPAWSLSSCIIMFVLSRASHLITKQTWTLLCLNRQCLFLSPFKCYGINNEPCLFLQNIIFFTWMVWGQSNSYISKSLTFKLIHLGFFIFLSMIWCSGRLLKG